VKQFAWMLAIAVFCGCQTTKPKISICYKDVRIDIETEIIR
jgi:hypothetical protein